jgi:hypothetical protein
MDPWQQPVVIEHSQRLLQSFQHWMGRSLLADMAGLDPEQQARRLFEAAFVVVSHGMEADPIFNYGNQVALDLWEFDWATFTQLPSRASVEPSGTVDREQLLAAAKAKGYSRDYQGIRISRSGQRFWIKDVILWDVLTASGDRCGQAATFPTWQFC